MRLLISLICILNFNNTIFAQEDGFDVFKAEVYPKLRDRCIACHAATQKPHHSSDSLDEAYAEAKGTLKDSDEPYSLMWERSYNNHCKKPTKCGEKKDELLQALKKWGEIDKPTTVDPFVEYGSAKVDIPQNIDETLDFNIQTQNNSSYIFSIIRLDASTVLIDAPRIMDLADFASFDGFELRTSDAEVASQNFNEHKAVIASITPELALPLNEEGSGYILMMLPEENSKSIQIGLYIKGWQSQLSQEEVDSLVAQGYYLVKD